MNKKNDVRWAVLLYLNYPLTLFLKFGGIFMSFFRAVTYLLTQRRVYLYIAYRGLAGSQLKKFPSMSRYFSL